MKHAATAVSAALISALAGSAWGQSFTVITNPADPSGGLTAKGVSSDGSIVAGYTLTSATGGSAVDTYLWSATGGFDNLVDEDTHGASRFEVTDLSANGQAVGGLFTVNGVFRPFIYTQADGFSRIETNNDSSHSISMGALSSDGSVAVGRHTFSDDGAFVSQAYRWTQATGMQLLGTLSNGTGGSSAHGISDDGNTIVGSSTGVNGFSYVPMRWTEANGMEALSTLNGSARAVTPSGDVIVGSYSSTGPNTAFRWTESTGDVELDSLPTGTGQADAFAVSDDGRYTVGWSSSGIFDIDWEAVIWTEDGEIRKLSDMLQDDFGIDMTGWQLISANDVSADGTTIVGTSIDPQGIRRGFVATIPAPAALSLIPITGLLTTRRRR